ncbi:MAG TPA: DUF4184 family protein [Kribbella sp.]
MPFPLAHPAAVLPLLRAPLVASALVAGALSPDLLYVDVAYRFATRQINGNFTLTLTHQLSSAFWLDPLIALLMLLLFHLVLRRPLLALAPPALAGRVPPIARPRMPGVLQLMWIVLSTIVGSSTHVLWDSFTHYDGYFVRHWSVLRHDLTPAWEVNRVLQYVSSVGGILLIAGWLYFWWRRTTPAPATADLPTPARYAVLVAAVALGAAGSVIEVAREDGPLAGESVLRLGLTGLATGALVGLVWYVVIWHALRLRRLRTSPDVSRRLQS